MSAIRLPKCPHGNYNGSRDGEPSFYCTGCTVSETQPTEQQTRELEVEWNRILQNSGM